jgi:hypothetical protein
MLACEFGATLLVRKMLQATGQWQPPGAASATLAPAASSTGTAATNTADAPRIDLDAADGNTGLTALSLAISNTYPETVAVLLRAGANVRVGKSSDAVAAAVRGLHAACVLE